MRSIFIAILMFFGSITCAVAGVSVSIGLNVPVYPQLVPVPGYPVYYAPGLNSNYFFYDGMYWVFIDDNWYASNWYNGPWELVAPDFVPLFVLRVPVRYYRHPPYYFRTWYANAPPRWGEHWGRTWERHHYGWNNWNRAAVPAPAPLPVYQRQYSGARYPAVEQQYQLQNQNYRYRPRDAVVQQHYQASSRVQSAPAPVQQSAVAPARSQPSTQRREIQPRPTAPMPSPQAAVPSSRGQPARTERAETQRAPVTQTPARQAAAPAPPQMARNQRSASNPPHVSAPSPRAQAPQRIARPEPQRAASAPPPQQRQATPPQEQHAQQRNPQGNGPPPSRGQNREREGGRG